MKKLLAVATIGVVGYVVVKKIKERKNNEVETTETEVVENVEEEIVVDNDEETIVIDDVELVDGEKDEMKIVDKIKEYVNKLVKVVGKFVCENLIKINRKLEKDAYAKNPYVHEFGFMNEIRFQLFEIKRIVKGTIVFINRFIMLVLVNLYMKIKK